MTLKCDPNIRKRKEQQLQFWLIDMKTQERNAKYSKTSNINHKEECAPVGWKKTNIDYLGGGRTIWEYNPTN